jgi:uncharacterized RDD family membrane protein YckC
MKLVPIEMVSRRAFFAFAVLLVGVAAPVAVAGPYDLFAEGAGEQLWTAQVVTNADKNLPGQRTIIRVRGAGESERWQQVAEIAAPALSLTHRGSELVVLLRGGDWRFVADSGVRSGDRLPGNQPILALAGDGTTLWAVGLAAPDITNGTSAATRGAATRPATAATTDVERAPPATTAATSPVPLLLYRLERGEWTAVAPLPTQLLPQGELKNEPTALRMAIINGHPLLGGLMMNGALRTVQLTDNNAWLDRGTITPPAAIERFELFGYRGQPALWAAAEAGAGAVYFHSDAWHGPTELNTQTPLDANVDRALAVAFGRLRLLYAGADGKLFEQSFNDQGRAESPPTQGQVQAQPPDPRIAQLVQLGMMVLLMFVMLSTLRRRGSIQEAMRKADRLALAPLGARFLAGVIDALPLLAVPVFVAITAHSLDQAVLKERMNDSVVQAWEGGAVLFYVAYTMLSEMFFGRTLGKLLFGLRVANLDGSRVTVRAAALRNVLRFIDLFLALFPLVMVFLSPLRQRIGDVAAGTLVVRSGVARPPQANSSDATDET